MLAHPNIRSQATSKWPSPRLTDMRTLGAGLMMAAVLAMAGCADDEPTGGPRTPAKGISVPPSLPAADLLQVEGDATAIDCLETGRRPADLGLWDPTVTAESPMELTAVRAIGTGVQMAQGSFVVPVIGANPAVSGASDWPIDPPNRMMRENLVWSGRTDLVGAALPVQRAYLPFLHIAAAPGAVLRGFEIDYRAADGSTGTARINADVRFAAGTC